MRTGDRKIFTNDRGLLTELINLRLNGFASTTLAIFFGCHRASIDSQCERYGIPAAHQEYSVQSISSGVLFQFVAPEPQWDVEDGMRFSKGKSYKEYLRESERRGFTKHIRIV